MNAIISRALASLEESLPQESLYCIGFAVELSQYIIGKTFSNSKIQYVEETETVLYRSKMSHGKNNKNFHVFDPLEFIAAITQHIPEKSFQLVRYYGWYSNRMRAEIVRSKNRLLSSTKRL